MLTHLTDAPVRPARVVVLGASGFIGAALVRERSARGVPVLPLASTDLDLCLADGGSRLAARLRADDSLVFASAITRDRGRDAATMMRNLSMAQAVLDALQRVSCRHVVYLSSDAVYGDDAANPVSEQTPCVPVDLYGVMHLAREGMVRHACAGAAVPLAILRPSIVYGPGDTHGSYGPNKWLRAALSGEPITLFGGGEERRDHVFIGDIVALISAVLDRRSHGVLNLVTGASPSFADVAAVFASVTGVPPAARQPRAVAITHRIYDVAAVRSAFPDFIPTPIDAGVARTWAQAARPPAAGPAGA